MAKPVKHPTLDGVTSETHPNLYDEASKTWFTPETKPKAFYPNGKPRKYISPEDRAAMLANAGPRRSDAESLDFWKGKLVTAQERHKKEIEGINKKIAYFSGERTRGGVDPEKAKAAAASYLNKGMTAEQILQVADELRLAAAAVKGKSEDEIKALVAPVAPPPFAGVGIPASV